MEPDVVTCCSLVSALERGGQWRLAEQLFSQMCAAAAAAGDQRALLLLQRVGAGNAPQSQGLGAPGFTSRAVGLGAAEPGFAHPLMGM